MIGCFLATALLALSPTILTAPTSSPDPTTRILAVRSALSIEGGRLTGPGATNLQSAVQGAHFVLLGEDHGEREIARFADALFTSLVPLGFRTIAVETGPVVAAKLRGWVAAPDGRARYAAFERTHGGTTAFYGWEDEYAFLEHAARSTDGALRLWGLDQELMGASKLLLESMLAQHPGPHSTTIIEHLLQEDASDYRDAARTGDPGQMFVLRIDPKEVDSLRSSLQRDGNARTHQLVQALIVTLEIYVHCCDDLAAKSNRDRALLMKQTLVAYLRGAGTYAMPPKIFFKFGAEHLYRGVSPLRNLDLGNYAAELGDGLGLHDIHILALGVSGKQSRFAGIGKPWQIAPYAINDIGDGTFRFLAPFVANMVSGAWTLYDLRPLRPHFSETGITDKEYERMVFGYDFLLLVPGTTADPAIAPDAF